MPRSPDPLRRLSQRLSWLLRHGAGERQLAMDPAGWVPVDQVLETLAVDRDALDAVITHNNKRRFERDGDRVRASQGHSLGHMPVTREALEASWRPYDGDDSVWHGTRIDALDAIATHGLLSVARTHVHLADAPDSSVGKRAGVALLLEVSVARLRARDLEVFVSPNGVVLTRHVPPACIVDLRPCSRQARAVAPDLRARLGL